MAGDQSIGVLKTRHSCASTALTRCLPLRGGLGGGGGSKGLTRTGGHRDLESGALLPLDLLLFLLGGEAPGLALDIPLVALQLVVGHLVEGVGRKDRLEEAHVVALVTVDDAYSGQEEGTPR